MNRYLIPWLIGMAMVALVGSGSPAGAMSAYSRIYKMECSECHTKNVPELNDFGIEFYKNRLVIPGKDKSGMPTGAQGTGSGAAAEKPASGMESTAPRTPAAAGDPDGGEAEEEEQKPVEEPPPTVVYRVKSADGSVFFTDNPLRKGGASQEQGRGTKKPAVVRPRKVAVPSGVKRAERPQAVTGSAGPANVAAVVTKRYRSYEECMERTLVRADAPGSAQEMMELITAVEMKCSAFSRETR